MFATHMPSSLRHLTECLRNGTAVFLHEIVALMFCRDVLRRPGKRQERQEKSVVFCQFFFNIILISKCLHSL